MNSGIFSVILYMTILLAVGLASRKKNQTSNDFILGSRKMNFWLTALAAHASDMSSWIFMAYPAVLFSFGFVKIWVAIGLCLFMFLNWQFVAPRLRVMTEKYSSMTLSSFFESRFNDTTGTIRIFTTISSFVFYIIYISSGLVSLGLLTETLFEIPYAIGITIGVLAIIPYLFIGGYITLAWTDLFQGIFLFIVILFVPLFTINRLGGFEELTNNLSLASHIQHFIPDYSFTTLLTIFFSLTSWGLGYFGQPTIITKFMGIKNPLEIPKSKWVGMTWQIFSLLGATLIGLVGIVYFQNGLNDPQLVFINIVRDMFSPLFAVFILCAILGTTITCTDSQILVLVSNLTEDFYKKIVRRNASSKELLLISRINILIVASIAYIIALLTTSSIFNLVSYAWFGLGASFGPLVLFSLYSKKVNKYGAWAGITLGTTIAAAWPLINTLFAFEIPTLIPGFALSSFAIWTVSLATQTKKDLHETSPIDL